MEQINYRKEAENWLKGYDLENSSFDIEESHADFAKYITEEFYSKQLAEKDFEYRKYKEAYEKEEEKCQDFWEELQEAKELLLKSQKLMNLVPNKKYGNNYEICSEITKFLTK